MEEEDDDQLAQLLKANAARKVRDEETRQRVRGDMATRMDSGVRVNEQLAKAFGVGGKAKASATAAAERGDKPTPENVMLRSTKAIKKATARVSSASILSSDAHEWLNDSQIGNLLALMPLPTLRKLKLNYPRGANVETIFVSATVRKMLDGSMDPPLEGQVQLYVQAGHWRELFISYAEKVVYYHEPYGSEMPASRAVRREFRNVLEARGWKFEIIDVALQTDAWNCGPWGVVVVRAFAAYMDSDRFGKGAFKPFLTEWLSTEFGVVDLRTVGERAAERRAANQAFIDAERERMRALLFEAAVDDKLAYTDGPLLDVFIEGKAKEATTAQLEAMDGE